MSDGTVDADYAAEEAVMEKIFAVSLATRIPAAIKRAEQKLCGAPLYIFTEELSITATEVALADELWEEHRKYCDEYNWDYNEPPPALCAFTEKIESLD